MTDFLFDGPEDPDATLLLAHGAGAAMDSAWMNEMTARLAGQGLRVARFEFAYMASRRTAAGRKPPPRAEAVMGEYRAAVAALRAKGALLIGGKSMGGRVASMVADALFAEGRIAGLVCLGYPFHPPGQNQKLRTAHLEGLRTPALICQGMRDPFGTAEEVPSYRLAKTIAVHWLADGDHDFKPRKESGATLKGNLDAAAEQIADFAKKCAG